MDKDIDIRSIFWLRKIEIGIFKIWYRPFMPFYSQHFNMHQEVTVVALSFGKLCPSFQHKLIPWNGDSERRRRKETQTSDYSCLILSSKRFSVRIITLYTNTFTPDMLKWVCIWKETHSLSFHNNNWKFNVIPFKFLERFQLLTYLGTIFLFVWIFCIQI